MMNSLQQMAEQCEKEGIAFWEMVLQNDMSDRLVSREASMQQMQQMYRTMWEADASYDPKLHSASGMVGGDGEKIRRAREQGVLASGDWIGLVMEKAVKMGESNACMRRIVAAPTAGACGVVPAVFLSMQEKYHYTEEKMLEALYVSAGIGAVIAERAFIAGASGGCQAEIGTASAMAAGGCAYLLGGDAEAIIHAAAMALKNLLGLVCDPVAGLVEVPCVKRNVIGAVNAVTTADLAIAGVRSHIPPDEVIDAMRSVGRLLPSSLRETGEGGLAATPEGIRISRNLR
ncbi:L-serine ammonia-lyase, iron-sulfur-dependent, subunit alpha [Lachnospiraceae bacterium CLA-AA-H215]|uniref:L-serine dehydratase n=1 Tax=Hominifimenecus microfluidus TaxID=2885348 RepID=A0AAE3JET4_9FIRM|nr:L-serine ammonia-lyase, iron-sulfur-dependent, subunit alpha [Hominifimenecus microfluidus]MCC2231444.1 L-serine ammonia-lyase, iron-sulfur-dependent, subunit alpha [Hominifimenecus microfluidus]